MNYTISLSCQVFIFLSIFIIKRYKINKKYLYSSILILSTIVTPPDILSQITLSFTIILIVETYIYLSILRKPIKLIKTPVVNNI